MRESLRHISTMRSPQLRGLDHDKTIVVVPLGLIEEHGPHLPLGTDTIIVTESISHIAREVQHNTKDFQFVISPTVEWGTQPIDDILAESKVDRTKGLQSMPISSDVLCTLIASIGRAIASRGFSTIVLINRHGSPLHVQSIMHACRFVREADGVEMHHIRLATTIDRLRRALSLMSSSSRDALGEGFLEKIKYEIHGGFIETSAMLFLRPDLVDSNHIELPDFPVLSREAIYRVPNDQDDWNGYYGYPRMAKQEFGEAIISVMASDVAKDILAIVDGSYAVDLDYSEDRTTSADQIEVDSRRLRREEAMRMQLTEWLNTQGIGLPTKV